MTSYAEVQSICVIAVSVCVMDTGILMNSISYKFHRKEKCGIFIIIYIVLLSIFLIRELLF